GITPTSIPVAPIYNTASSTNMIRVARATATGDFASPEAIATNSSPRKLNRANDAASKGEPAPWGRNPPETLYSAGTRFARSKAAPTRMNAAIVTTFTIANQYSKVP